MALFPLIKCSEVAACQEGVAAVQASKVRHDNAAVQVWLQGRSSTRMLRRKHPECKQGQGGGCQQGRDGRPAVPFAAFAHSQWKYNCRVSRLMRRAERRLGLEGSYRL
jgi:hypothetical protein